MLLPDLLIAEHETGQPRYREMYDRIVTRFRPTVLFAPILAAYDHILELAGGLDVRALLDPIIAALADIEVQLEEGLQDAAAALTRLQEALP